MLCAGMPGGCISYCSAPLHGPAHLLYFFIFLLFSCCLLFFSPKACVGRRLQFGFMLFILFLLLLIYKECQGKFQIYKKSGSRPVRSLQNNREMVVRKGSSRGM